jgi:hypothetical protein
MAGRAEAPRQAMKKSHPYKAHEKTELWEVVSRAVGDLVDNGDVLQETAREYIVGYLCEKLKEAGFQRVELRAGPDVRYVVELRPATRSKKAG